MTRSDRLTAALAVATAAFVSAPGTLQAQATTPGTVVRRRVPGERDPDVRDPGAREPRFKFSVKGQSGRVDLPRRRGLLGLENIDVRPVPRFVFEPDDEADMTGGEARLDFDTTGIIPSIGPDSWFGGPTVTKRTWVGVGLRIQEFDINRSLVELNPRGDALLLAGPEGGVSGFRLTDPFSQGANIARNLRLNSDYDRTTGFAEIGQMCFYPNGFGIGGFLGTSLGRLEFSERFNGAIPGFFADFQYDTDINVDEWRLYKGIEVEQWFTPHFAAFFSGDAGVNFLDVSGHDRLDFKFFGGDQRSVNTLDHDDTEWSYRASGGLKLKASLLEASIGAFWERETGFPVLDRDGENPSRVRFEDADTWGAFGRVSLGFGNPPPSASAVDAILTY